MYSTIEQVKRPTYIVISVIGLVSLFVSTYVRTFSLSIEGDMANFEVFIRPILFCLFTFALWSFSTKPIALPLGERIFVLGLAIVYVFRFAILLFTGEEWFAVRHLISDTLWHFPALSALVFFAYNFQYALVFSVILHCIISFLFIPFFAQMSQQQFESVFMFDIIRYQLHVVAMLVIIAMLGHSKERWLHFHREARRMKKLAYLDPLTNVANRRGLSVALHEAIQGNKGPLTIVLFDIDSFKNINDQFGHLIGDAVLVATANVVRKVLRAGDCFGRWGGEEFVVICENTTLAEGMQMAERLRSKISSHPFQRVGMVTASFGVVERMPNERAEQLLARADRMLYKAKAEGKNRVEYSLPTLPMSECE